MMSEIPPQPDNSEQSEFFIVPENKSSWLEWFREKVGMRISSSVMIPMVPVAALYGCQNPGEQERERVLDVFLSIASSESEDKSAIEYSVSVSLNEGVSPQPKTMICTVIPVINGKADTSKSQENTINVVGKFGDNIIGSFPKTLQVTAINVTCTDNYGRTAKISGDIHG